METNQTNLMDCLSNENVEQALAAGRAADAAEVKRIIEKARTKKGLTAQETAVLLYQDNNPDVVKEIMDAARQIKEEIYGKRIVFFAPLYISNFCANNCLYCAYRRDNTEITRKTLTPEEIARQVEVLEDQGHKRLLLVAGETNSFLDVLNALETIYATRTGQGEIRRVNVNIAPPTIEQLKALKKTGIGTYQCFQETYHHATYRQMHPDGPKADYQWRLEVMDRAMQAGVDDVSTGVLLGLYDYHYDVTALIMHGLYLDQTYRVGPHAVSVPRLRVAHGTPLCDDVNLNQNRYLLTDQQFQLVVAVIRMALPYTGVILTTRETPAMRNRLLNAGVSQISAGSHTEVGGYSGELSKHAGQFEIEDVRSLEDVILDVIASGNIASFCTACYRVGRTGEKIMDLLKPGTIKNFCLPNAVLTFKEYLVDYASPETREKGKACIDKLLQGLDNDVREETQQRLGKIEQGERDLYF
ncbi:[FeFe] hydrogenase H-cluster radical SAM maturase HydG [bacterium]|nr:[FeFe] hydrogenase H-cluster radical SAM maturase HydG [bacterium]